MAKKVNNYLGWVLILIGLIGLGYSGFLGMHLNPAHAILLCATGLLSLVFGREAASDTAARLFAMAAGSVYAVVSIIGLFAGPGVPAVAEMKMTGHLLRLVPGSLEFSSADSWWQLAAGLAYLAGACLPWRKPSPYLAASGSERPKAEAGRQ